MLIEVFYVFGDVVVNVFNGADVVDFVLEFYYESVYDFCSCHKLCIGLDDEFFVFFLEFIFGSPL